MDINNYNQSVDSIQIYLPYKMLFPICLLSILLNLALFLTLLFISSSIVLHRPHKYYSIDLEIQIHVCCEVLDAEYYAGMLIMLIYTVKRCHAG